MYFDIFKKNLIIIIKIKLFILIKNYFSILYLILIIKKKYLFKKMPPIKTYTPTLIIN